MESKFSQTAEKPAVAFSEQKPRARMSGAASALFTLTLQAWSADRCPAPALRFALIDAGMVGSHQEQMTKFFLATLDSRGEVDPEEARALAIAYASTVVPGIVFAAIILLCCFPLWIARCRAHRCCAPQPKPRKSTRIMANCCFPLVGLAARLFG